MKILTDQFIKSVLVLISGSFIGQIVNFISAPIMTRLFTVTDIGVFTYINSIASIFIPVICLRYENAIVLENNNSKVFALIKLCFLINLFFSIIIFLFLSFYFFNNEIFKYIFMIFLIVFISGTINILTAFNTREKNFNLLSKLSIYRPIVNFIFILIFGIFHSSFLGLLFAYILSLIAGIFSQMKDLLREKSKLIKFSRFELKSVGKKYLQFPKYSMPAIFFNNISYLSLNFFISHLYGMDVLGYYSLSYRVLGVPLTLISNNIGNVFYEKASKDYYSSGSFKIIFIRTFKLLFLLTLPITLVIYFISPWFCSVYFGENWYIAGEYIQLLSLLFGIRFIVSPLTSGILVLKENRIELMCQFAFFMVTFALFLYCKIINLLSVNDFLLFLSIGFSIIYCMFGYIIYKLS